MGNGLTKKRRLQINFLTEGRLISDFEYISESNGQLMLPNLNFVRDKQTKEIHSLFTLKKKFIQNLKALKNQLGIRKRMENSKLLKVFFVFEEKEALKVVTERFNGKRVKDFLSIQKSISEDEQFLIFFQMALAVEAFHSLKIKITDLNTSDFLIDQDGNVKFSDFIGENAVLAASGLKKFKTFQTFSNSSSLKTNIWSLGVMLFELLAGKSPFEKVENFNIKDPSKRMKFHLPPEINVSDSVAILLDSMLQANPNQRLNITDIFSSEWFQQKAFSLNININDRNKLNLIGNEKYYPQIDQKFLKNQAILSSSSAYNEQNNNNINEIQIKNIRTNCNVPANSSFEPANRSLQPANNSIEPRKENPQVQNIKEKEKKSFLGNADKIHIDYMKDRDEIDFNDYLETKVSESIIEFKIEELCTKTVNKADAMISESKNHKQKRRNACIDLEKIYGFINSSFDRKVSNASSAHNQEIINNSSIHLDVRQNQAEKEFELKKDDLTNNNLVKNIKFDNEPKEVGPLFLNEMQECESNDHQNIKPKNDNINDSNDVRIKPPEQKFSQEDLDKEWVKLNFEESIAIENTFDKKFNKEGDEIAERISEESEQNGEISNSSSKKGTKEKVDFHQESMQLETRVSDEDLNDQVVKSPPKRNKDPFKYENDIIYCLGRKIERKHENQKGDSIINMFSGMCCLQRREIIKK